MPVNLDLLTELRKDRLPGFSVRLDRRARVVDEIARRHNVSRDANPRGLFATSERFELEAMLDAGEPLDQLDQRIAARLAAETAGTRALAELTSMRTLLNDEIRAAESDAYYVLPMLHSSLTERVDEASALGPIEQIATPDAAKRSKQYAAHDRLMELVGELGTLRFEQFRVLRESGHAFAPKASILHVLRNVEAVFPNKGWAPWLAPGWLGKRGSDERREIDTPWPRPLTGTVLTDDFGVWALQAGADQWVPTLEQYDAAATALTRKARAPREDDGRFGEWYDPGPQARYERPRNLSQRSR